jgi:aminoglycoside N3'-acetyltransferase
MNTSQKKMRKVTQTQIIECLKELKIRPGDGLLVHSSIQLLGLPEDGPGIYLRAIQSTIGSDGTIAVPTFNFAFARGEDYDPLIVPSDGMGSFSEYVRQHPDSFRTTHPMQSLSVLGNHAQDLAGRDTPSAFDDGSAFDRMLELDFKMLLLGADIQASAITHYSEQRAQVPYRHWKEFSGQVISQGKTETRTYRMYVRDMELDPRLTGEPIQALLEQRSQWAQTSFNYGHVSTCTLRDFIAVMDEILKEDPWALVTNRPVDQSTSEAG